MNKNIELYSNPDIVFKKAKKLFGDDFELYLSSRKDKKYMIKFSKTKKFIHFGQYGFEDFTKHKNKKRRDLFQIRNKKWADSIYNSPSYLSYYLLW
jgi:hypothetical protein